MKYPYQDPSLSPQERTDDLLSRMSLEEKFAQMRLYYPRGSTMQQVPFDVTQLEENRHRCGAVYNANTIPPENVRIIQDWYMKNTRWGIPVAFHSESLHGLMSEDATVFPQAVGLGAAFSRELMTEVVTQIGKEARSHGVNMTYAPNVDLSRDPRWGRVEENYGEDPYLTSELGVAYVKALQAQGVSACPKHYIAHGSPESGINLAPVHAGEREFRETMMVPFQKVVMEGKAEGIMPAYSEWDGVAIHASRPLLTDLLRGEFGFTGQVVSDFGAVKMLDKFHHVAACPKDAGKMALCAGVDMEAPAPYGFGPDLEEAARKGEIHMEWVDTAVRRILLHKFQKGLFENPYADEEAIKNNRNAEALALTKRAATESVVLLKNEDNLLPLSDSIGKIALIGPNANNAQLGGYTVQSAIGRAVTLRQAMEERLGKDRVLFEQGCTTAHGTDAQIDAAVEAAKQADVAVVVLGDNANYFGGIGWGDAELDGKVSVTCGEGFDMCSLELPGRQEELLKAVFATGKPVVLILETGRPYAVCWAKENIPAIMQAWYPGEQGGYALADLLFGDANPSGRLPISFPRSVGHIPCFYNHKVTAKGYYKVRGTKEVSGRDYVFDTPDSLFSFGDGMSYTTFTYSDLTVPETAATDAQVDVTVTVENTGDRAGYEVVQLYVRDKVCRITPFIRRLRGFEKIWLEPGQKKQVSFKLGFEDFAFVNEQMKLEVEPGEFIIRVGDQKATVTLV